ncbi:DUF2017 domain-containing protein [Actinomadura atramentaria]|uniref:DUF2017 domain-containing protein n=1 Tax=Actinomadura atramentaria TaxID=1990 RepID=UPI00036E53CE|nr:DUF2017 domain-containing protein [Actinomadura atramentaria]
MTDGADESNTSWFQVGARPGGVRVRLGSDAAGLLRALMEQLLDLVGDAPDDASGLAAFGIAESAERPDDPALARLFPDGYRDDDAAADEFRRFTELGLRDAKRETARAVLDVLDTADDELTAELDEAGAVGWMRAVNDVRLVIGTRLDIDEDGDNRPDLDPADPRAALYAFYDWLTAFQSALVYALE